MNRHTFAAIMLGTSLWFGASSALAQYCPSYAPSTGSNCAQDPIAGTNPTIAQWNDIFAIVSEGPSAWGTQGPSVPDIGQGCGKPEPSHNVPARFPCELLKSIAMVETGWQHFCDPTTPASEVGQPSRTIISFDCGYGIGQVTSGMRTFDATPDFDRARVAGEPIYNMATGVRILADKWRATSCVGDNQPTIIEDWYVATWAYNGLAWSNNPNYPNYAPDRGVFDPAVNSNAGWAYQEKVFGRIETQQFYWDNVALAYPDRSECGSTGSPPDLSEPHCASPTDCANTRSTHATACNGSSGAAGSGGSAGASGSGGSAGTAGSAGTGGASGGNAGSSGSAGSAGSSGSSGSAGSAGSSGSAGNAGASASAGSAGTGGVTVGDTVTIRLERDDGGCSVVRPRSGHDRDERSTNGFSWWLTAIVLLATRRTRRRQVV